MFMIKKKIIPNTRKKKFNTYDVIYSETLEGKKIKSEKQLKKIMYKIFNSALDKLKYHTNNKNYRYDKQYLERLEFMFFRYFLNDFYNSDLKAKIDIELFSDIYKDNIVEILITFDITQNTIQ